jgi:uncharacterized protein (TIGR02996 family)
MRTLFDPAGRLLHEVEPFLNAIRENPDEDTLRLVFADFLQDRGDPERGDDGHARLIRAQCEQARTPPFTARWYELNRVVWEILCERRLELTPCPGRVRATYSRFVRGFPTAIVVRAPSALRGAGRAFDVGTVDTLEVVSVRDAGVLARQLAVARVTGLRLFDLRPGGLERLVGEADVSRIRRWSVHGERGAARDALALASAVRSRATAVEELEFDLDTLGGTTAGPLVEIARGMRRGLLDVSYSSEGDEVLRGLTADPPADPGRGLRTLNLAYAFAGDDGVRSLAGWAGARHLEYLDLSESHFCGELGDQGVEALAASEHLSGLRVLSLAGTEVSDRGLAALARTPATWGMRLIDLSDTAVTAGGVALLRDRFPDCRIDTPELLR